MKPNIVTIGLKIVLIICALFYLHLNGIAQKKLPQIHSHNDYHQNAPFFAAFQAEATMIEIDVILEKGELFVAHDKQEIKKNRTVENLYIKPLQQLIAKGEYIHTIQYLVDIKSEAESTLKKLIEIASKHPTIFNNKPHGVRLIISGNRPKQEAYLQYPDYIMFDGRNPSELTKTGSNKIALISRNFSDFSKWKGAGSLPEKDSIKAVNFINNCHAQNCQVRFWNTKDTSSVYRALLNLDVDFINTDKPFEVAQFLNLLDTRKKLPSWEEGFLDIHHINTGRGNATFVIFPDGTTLLIDMGDMSETHSRILSHRSAILRPNSSKTPAQWVANYIKQFHPKRNEATIDYALITHYHDDHFGEIDTLKTKHTEGNYLLTGITELGSIIPIAKMVDRGYDFPIDLKDEKVRQKFDLYNDSYSMIGTLAAYWKYIDYQKEKTGLKHETFILGTEEQFKLKYQVATFGNFKVKNLFANGQFKDKHGKVQSLFAKGSYPGENPLSTGIKISYGNFDYYTGADINGIGRFGEENTGSTEYKFAPIIGAVDVATLNHHGNRDSNCPTFVRTLQPKVWVQQGWSSDHPGDEVLRRITSTNLYPGKRDIFATALLKANHLVIGSDIEESYKALSGHIVIRVDPAGNDYSVFVLNDKTTTRNIVAEYKYKSR